GSNGYSAGSGFDLVTGRGSPVANLLVPALAGFSGTSAQPPTITSAATATFASPTAATLNVGAAAPAGSNDPLSYSWSLTGTPPAAVSFSTNNSGSASTTQATFSR